MEDLPIYQIKWEDELDGIIYGISIVDKPANQMEFIKMNSEIKLKELDKEKQLLTGVVLKPNQLVYRNSPERGEYNLMFNEETIEKLSFEYLERGFQKNSTYNHENRLEGISVVESWIVKDSNSDKAKSLGFNVPDGTWMVTMRLSDELWEDYIKTGKATGFSIDAILNQEKIDNEVFKINKKNNKINMLKERLLKAISLFEDKQKEEEVKMEEFESGDTKYSANSFKEGEMVYVEDSEGEKQPFLEGSFEKDGEMFTTDDKGVIISALPIEEGSKEEEKKEEMKTTKEEAKTEFDSLSEDELNMLKDYLGLSEVEKNLNEKAEKLELSVKEKETSLTEKDSEIEKLKGEIVKLKEELDTTPAEKKLGAEGKEPVNLREMSLTEKLSWINNQVKEK